MNSRYVDEVKLDVTGITEFKASNDAFRPLGVAVKQNGIEEMFFYFEDVELELNVPKKNVTLLCLKTMQSIPDGYKYISTVIFERRAIHVYIK